MKICRAFLFLMITSPLLKAQPSPEAPLSSIRLTDSVFCTEVKDQGMSPTCWTFGSNSLFESDLEKKNGARLNLSEMFIARYAYIDKAEAWLASKGKTYYEGGGQFRDVIRIINRYGIVPEDIYNGRPHGEYMHNHAGLDTAMRRFANELLIKGNTSLNETDLLKINDTLDRYLGKVPETFWFNQQQYNPKTFAAEIGLSGDDYIDLMSFAGLPFYKRSLLADEFNWAGDSLFNITLEDMQMVVDTALAHGWSVGWEGDVTEPGFNFLNGYATISDSDYQYPEKRIQDFGNGSTKRDHMLHVVGMGHNDQNKKWYYLKNSWGIWFSKFRGFLFMDENYFKLKTVVLMVNKQALPQSLQHKLRLDIYSN